MLIIRKGDAADAEAVGDMLCEVVDHLHATGKNYPNWHHGIYPTPEVPVAAAKRGDLYVAEENGKTIGTVTVNCQGAPEYADIAWQADIEPCDVRVIHTLAVSPSARGTGLAKKLMEFAESLARAEGARAIRLDTFGENTPAQSLYLSLGYSHMGFVTFTQVLPEGQPYAVFEKIL